MTPSRESEWSNLAWMTALRADSDPAWAAIRERVHRSLRAFLHGRGEALADADAEALAEDAVQETLLAVRAKLDTFRNDSRFTTQVHRIAVSALRSGQLRQWRWNVRSPETADDAVPDWPIEEGAPAPERAVLQRELWTLVRQLIEVEPIAPLIARTGRRRCERSGTRRRSTRGLLSRRSLRHPAGRGGSLLTTAETRDLIEYLKSL